MDFNFRCALRAFLVALSIQANAVADYYSFLRVPSNASQLVIIQAYRERIRSAHPQERIMLDEAFVILGNVAKRAEYDKIRRIESGQIEEELETRLRATLMEEYALTDWERLSENLLRMAKKERELFFHHINERHEREAAQLKRAEVPLEERRIYPVGENERHFVMRKLLEENALFFLAKNPSYQDADRYLEGLSGTMSFPEHYGYGFGALARMGLLNFELASKYAVYLGDKSSTKDEFLENFSYWVGVQKRAEYYVQERFDYDELQKWYEKFEERFQSSPLEAARAALVDRTDSHDILVSLCKRLKPAMALQLINELVQEEGRRPYKYSPKLHLQNIKDLEPVLSEIYSRDPSLRTAVEKHGSTLSWVVSVFSNKAHCRYVLAKTSMQSAQL